MKRAITSLLLTYLALILLPFSAVLAQTPSVTFSASTTTGDGTLTTDLTWSSTPALPGTPCAASGLAPQWQGAKAASGTLTGLTISTSGTLNLTLTCTFPADTSLTVNWTNPTQNTDGSPLTNLSNVRIKYGFVGAISSNPAAAAGETMVDVAQTPTPTTTLTRTITGTGTLHVAGLAQNSQGVWSSLTMPDATKVFTGSANPIQKTVTLTINPKPNTLPTLTIQ